MAVPESSDSRHCVCLIQLHPLRYYAEKYEQLQRHYAEQYPFDESEYISYPRYGMYRTKSMWNTKRASWDSYIEIPFEDTTIRVPKATKMS